MTRHEATALATRLMDMHLTAKGITGWSFSINTNKSRLGVCRYNDKSIEVSIYHVTGSTDAEITNTILHEIAHAKTQGHHHDWTWKSVARSIGCTGERCGKMNVPESLRRKAQFIGTCAVCGVEIPRFKMSKMVMSTTAFHKACGRRGTISWRAAGSSKPVARVAPAFRLPGVTGWVAPVVAPVYASMNVATPDPDGRVMPTPDEIKRAIRIERSRQWHIRNKAAKALNNRHED